MPDGLEFLFRPVLAGLIKYESLLDGSIGLEDIADLNDALDIQAHNTALMETRR